MRRTIAIILTLLACVSASNAKEVNEPLARTVAQRFLQSKGFSETKSSSMQLLMKNDAFYVFGYPSKGFVIIASDDSCRPVLGYSLDNDFCTDDMPENMKTWFAQMGKQVGYIKSLKLQQDEQTALLWENPGAKTKAGTKKKHIETATWHQRSPFNGKAPVLDKGKGHTVTGCTNTAMAIIMRHYKWPEAGTGTLPDYDSYSEGGYVRIKGHALGHKYDWDSMLMNYDKGYTKEQGDAVATLLYDLGVMNMSNWGYGGTSATAHFTGLSEYFGYDSSIFMANQTEYKESEWEDMIRKEIDADRLIWYSGSTLEDGHAFVLDGYDEGGMFHFNFGWGGGSNGYYSLIPAPEGKDPVTYIYGQQAVFGICPDAGGNISCPPPFCPSNHICFVLESLLEKHPTFQFACSLRARTARAFSYSLALAHKNKSDDIIEVLSEPQEVTVSYDDYSDIYLEGRTPVSYSKDDSICLVYKNADGTWKEVPGTSAAFSSGRAEDGVSVRLNPVNRKLLLRASTDTVIYIESFNGTYRTTACGSTLYFSHEDAEFVGGGYKVKAVNLNNTYEFTITL